MAAGGITEAEICKWTQCLLGVLASLLLAKIKIDLFARRSIAPGSSQTGVTVKGGKR